MFALRFFACKQFHTMFHRHNRDIFTNFANFNAKKRQPKIYVCCARASTSGGDESGSKQQHKEVDRHMEHGERIKMPLATMDDIPVPKLPYKQMYDKENWAFNLILAGGIIVALATAVYVWYYDVLLIEASSMPKSYRNRHKEIAKHKEEDAKVAKSAAAEAAEVAELTKNEEIKKQEIIAATGKLPEHVKYLLIGGGTASFSAFRAIKGRDADAKILVIGDENDYPYMRPPLSKELWFSDDKNVTETLRFKQWGGKERNLFYEKPEFFCKPDELNEKLHGGVSSVRGRKVKKIDAEAHEAILDDDTKIKYDKCLIATGGTPKSLPEITNAGPDVLNHVTLYRRVDDFKKLDKIVKNAKNVVIIGGGFLGSELACALAQRSSTSKFNVTQIFPESGNLGHVLPKYLSTWTTNQIAAEGVDIIPSANIENASFDGSNVNLRLSNGKTVQTDHVIVAVGIDPNVELAKTSDLEVDPELGGFRCDAELRARTDIWVAGDCCSFYDSKLGRRRVEHHDHAIVSGRLAGENMASSAGKPYFHQSMFWSDLGPRMGFEAVGIIDSSLPTMGIFAKAEDNEKVEETHVTAGEAKQKSEKVAALTPKGETKPTDDDYAKGVIFYLKEKKIVGILLWNLYNRISIARKILKEDMVYEDLNEVAKLFNIHDAPPVEPEN